MLVQHYPSSGFSTPYLMRGGNIVNKDEEKAEVLNASFASVINSQTGYAQGRQPPVLEDREGVRNKPPIIQKEADNHLLCHLDTYKSMGPDGIHLRVLRELAEELAKPLSVVYQQSWLTGVVPDHTESQNHRMLGVGRDLWGSPSPTPCRSRVTQSRLHRTASRRGCNISRKGDSTTSLGSLGQGSITLRGKKFFLRFRQNFLCFSLFPLPLVLSLGTTEKSLAPSS